MSNEGMVRHIRRGWFDSGDLFLNRVAPSLVHDYANNRYWNSSDGETGFPFTATRTTNAMMTDRSGMLKWAPVNMATYSEMGSVGFPVNSSTVTLAAIPCPSGTIVNKMVANNGVVLNGNDGLGCVTLVAVTTVTNQTYCMSFYAKAAEVTSVRVRDTIGGGRSTISLIDGTVTLESGAQALTHLLVTSQDVGDGWWRIICRRTAAGTTQGLDVKPGDTTGDGVSGLYLSGFQMEPDDLYTPKSLNVTTGTAYYGPRLDSDPITGEARGILIEDARSNLCLNSHTYQTGWVLTNVTLSTLTTDPMGLTFGRTVLEGAPAITALLSAAFATTGSTQYNASVYLKRGNTDWIRFRCVDTTSTDGFQCWVNLGTGAIGTANLLGTGTYTTSSAKITALPNGWYRVSMAGTIGAAVSMRLSTVTATANTSTTNVNAGTYEVWGHQVELTNESSYIPTYSASATRAIDALQQNIPAAINQARGTWLAKIVKSTVNNISNGRLLGINDGTSNNAIELFVTTSGASQIRSAIGGVTSFVPVCPAGLTNMTETKVCTLYQSPTKKVVMNGGSIVADAVVNVPTSGYTKFFVGSSNGASSAHNGWIKEIRYYAEATASDTQITALTA